MCSSDFGPACCHGVKIHGSFMVYSSISGARFQPCQVRISGKSYEALCGYLTDHKLDYTRWRWRSHTRSAPGTYPGNLALFRPWQNCVLSARCGLSTRQPAFVDNIYLRHNARWAGCKYQTST